MSDCGNDNGSVWEPRLDHNDGSHPWVNVRAEALPSRIAGSLSPISSMSHVSCGLPSYVVFPLMR